MPRYDLINRFAPSVCLADHLGVGDDQWIGLAVIHKALALE